MEFPKDVWGWSCGYGVDVAVNEMSCASWAFRIGLFNVLGLWAYGLNLAFRLGGRRKEGETTRIVLDKDCLECKYLFLHTPRWRPC
jgi:hypothetical protein